MCIFYKIIAAFTYIFLMMIPFAVVLYHESYNIFFFLNFVHH